MGVLGTAKIGVNKVIPGMAQAGNCRVIAIASRELSKARNWANRLSLPIAYGSYEELLADPQIDAIYNPLRITCMSIGPLKRLRLGSTFSVRNHWVWIQKTLAAG